MGNKVPVMDDQLMNVKVKLELKNKHIIMLWKAFGKLDLDKDGLITLDDFYKLIDMRKSIFADTLFDLIDVDGKGVLTFGQFVSAMATYCLFSQVEVLKFCFFVFDREKNGYIEKDELHALVGMLHEKESTSVKAALRSVDEMPHLRIEFSNFHELNICHPALLYPAHRMIDNMKNATGGKRFWLGRRKVLAKRAAKRKKEEDKKHAAEQRKAALLQRKQLIADMGIVFYYIAPCMRGRYVRSIAPVKVKDEKEKVLEVMKQAEEEVIAEEEKEKEEEEGSPRKKKKKKRRFLDGKPVTAKTQREARARKRRARRQARRR